MALEAAGKSPQQVAVGRIEEGLAVYLWCAIVLRLIDPEVSCSLSVSVLVWERHQTAKLGAAFCNITISDWLYLALGQGLLMHASLLFAGGSL